jgi:hypothetical protein
MDAERFEKTCRFCREPIDAQAKRCPHCCMPQTRWVWSMHPAVWLVFMFALLALLVGMMLNVRHAFVRGREFTAYEGKLVALDSLMDTRQKDGGSFIHVSGKLQNNSRVAWKDIETECRFFDAEGKLIDVDNDTQGVTVPPGKSRMFFMEHATHLPPERYARHEVRVRWAKEAE